MKRTTFFTSGLLMLALLATPVFAQSSAAPQSESPPQTEPDSANTAGGIPATPASPEASTEPAPRASSKDSPFDYRASEEISEDLPVSFPVDI